MNGDEKKTLTVASLGTTEAVDSSPLTLVSCWSFDLLSMTIDDEIDNSANEIDIHNGDLVNQSHRA